MAQKSEVVSRNSIEDCINLQDVLYSFNNSISEEQAWAVCYQCVQFFVQNSSQDNYRDLYYYGIIAIQLSKDGDVKIEVNFNQGTGKGPPKKRSSFSLSREFKTNITESDVTQALGTAIYKALDYGLSESEEPHLSSELETLILSLTDQPADDDEGIDIERDSDQDIEESHGQNQSLFQNIIDKCVWRLSNQQNAQQHYKAVCRALATEATELLTFLDNIARGQEKLSSTTDGEQTVDDLERSDWARLWVQTMRELRHGVRLKKVEQVHLPPVEYELTPFEILLEDIRLGRYKLNRIMVNGDIPKKVKADAHAVILDFIRSRPPLKPVNRRLLKDPPKREMDARELLLADICKPHTLKPVRHGKRVVRKPTQDCDSFNYSSDEETVKPTRKVIKPVAAFQVSTDDSDSFVSDIEEDCRNHIVPSVMSPLEPVGPDDIEMSWKRAVSRDLIKQPSNCQSVTRRHTISACDVKSRKQERQSDRDDNAVEVKTETMTLRRSRTAVIRARSKPDVRSQQIKEEEEKHFKFIEQSGLSSNLERDSMQEVRRSASEVSFDRRARPQAVRARNHVRRPISTRSSSGSEAAKHDAENVDGNRRSDENLEDKSKDDLTPTKREVRLTRQSAIRSERPDVQSKLPSKSVSGTNDSKINGIENESIRVSRPDVSAQERVRRSGIVSSNRVISKENGVELVEKGANRISLKSDVMPSNTDIPRTPRRHEFKQVRPVVRSRSEVRQTKPVKGSHNLPVDFEHNNLDQSDDKHVIIPPPEFRDPEDKIDNQSNNEIDTKCDIDNIPDVIKTSRAEFKIVDLLHVSWKSECTRVDHTNQSISCPDCRPSLPPHKWQNPIECLSLTLEEVTHIRCVLTKAELEGLITNPELHSQVSKGKVCFTCKKTKFSLFGQWGTKCKFCQRTVCNYCLRKMSVPTEHFEKIPVYTLSPVPLSQDVLDALKVYESTGSVPHSPVFDRKPFESGTNVRKSSDLDSQSKEDEEEAVTPTADEDRLTAKRRSLQRSHTIGVGVGSRPPPNKALLKGPQMSICSDCKAMIMEIIRASRSSVSLITGKPDISPEQKDSPTDVRNPITPRSSGTMIRPRNLDVENRARPRSMFDNFKSFNFTRADSTDA